MDDLHRSSGQGRVRRNMRVEFTENLSCAVCFTGAREPGYDYEL